MLKFKWERKQFKIGVGVGEGIACDEIIEEDHGFDERPDI